MSEGEDYLAPFMARQTEYVQVYYALKVWLVKVVGDKIELYLGHRICETTKASVKATCMNAYVDALSRNSLGGALDSQITVRQSGRDWFALAIEVDVQPGDPVYEVFHDIVRGRQTPLLT